MSCAPGRTRRDAGGNARFGAGEFTELRETSCGGAAKNTIDALVFTDITGPNNVDVHNFYYLPPSLFVNFFVLFQNRAG